MTEELGTTGYDTDIARASRLANETFTALFTGSEEELRFEDGRNKVDQINELYDDPSLDHASEAVDAILDDDEEYWGSSELAYTSREELVEDMSRVRSDLEGLHQEQNAYWSP